jgi:hypothetical protein
MERTIRGLLEKELDSLTPESLEKAVDLIQQWLPLKSVEDFLLGYVFGGTYLRFLTIIQVAYRREATDAEIKECFEMIERRILEIKGKIKLAMSK